MQAVDAKRQREFIRHFLGAREPAAAEVGRLPRRAHAHEFAHAEGLEAIDLVGRFAPETIGFDVEFVRPRRHRPACGGERIERIAGRRRQHEIGRAQRVGPILAAIEPPDRGMDFRLVALQAADAAEQMRKAVEIACLLDVAAGHHRRKPQHLSVGFAAPRDQRRQRAYDGLEQRRAAMDTIAAGWFKQRAAERLEPIVGAARTVDASCLLAGFERCQHRRPRMCEMMND
jgi:hypothetical protein